MVSIPKCWHVELQTSNGEKHRWAAIRTSIQQQAAICNDSTPLRSSSYRLCIEASNTSLGLNASSLTKQTPWSCTNLLPQLRCQRLLVASGATGKSHRWTIGQNALQLPSANVCPTEWHDRTSWTTEHLCGPMTEDGFLQMLLLKCSNFKPPMERNIICFFCSALRPKRCDYVDRSLQPTPDWWFQPTPKAYIQKHCSIFWPFWDNHPKYRCILHNRVIFGMLPSLQQFNLVRDGNGTSPIYKLLSIICLKKSLLG